MVKILPSLLSIDFLNLKEELQLLEAAKVDGLHFDVMDGKFVPNISIGIPILDAVRQQFQSMLRRQHIYIGQLNKLNN